MPVMMKCGHVANAIDSHGNPRCAICVGLRAGADEVDNNPPDLSGRMARCSCGNKQPSRLDLPFFEYCGPGSRESLNICTCGYAFVAHTPEVMERNKALKCNNFTPRGPLEFDRQYCGCRGWD